MSLSLLRLAVFMVFAEAAGAGTLLELWQMDLKKAIKEMPSSTVRAPTVFALRFSPDGQRIAVVTEQYVLQGGEARKTHLLVVPVHRPGEQVRQFEVSAGAIDLDNLHSWPNLHWTARGDAILAFGELVQVDRQACALTENLRAPGATLHLTENAYADADRVAKFLLLDAACKPEGKWEFSRDWAVEDVSLDHGRICVRQPIQWGSNDIIAAGEAQVAGMSDDILVVDPISGRTLQRWPPSIIRGVDIRFGDEGRVICAGRRSENPGKALVRCWDIETGKQIGEAPNVSGGDPIAVAAGATRAVASDYRYVAIPFIDGHKEVLKRRIVWDFKTSKELASWHPELQPYDIGLMPVKKAWWAFAISPDGQYIAEGGNGLLRLYKIEP